MKLSFAKQEVKELIEHSFRAQHHKSLYGNPETCVPGLFLVGDEGVYLASNGVPRLEKVVYASECDPNNLPFEQWWSVKVESFGGSDGVELLKSQFVKSWMKAQTPNELLSIEVTPQKIVIP